MIAIFGATGNTGRAAFNELRALGENPICISRDEAKARDVLGADAKIAVADLMDRAALEKALAGVKRIFLVTGNNPQVADQQISVLNAAKAAGVEFIVKVSAGQSVMGPKAESFVGRGHYEIEEAMLKIGIDWSILRPGLFMQNTLAAAPMIKNENKFAMPFAKDLPLALIDTRDAGAIGARILKDPAGHAGKTYEFTGKVTTFENFAKVFSEVLGRPITYIPATRDQAEQAMKSRGMPDWLISHLLVIAKLASSGAFSNEDTRAIREIVGRDPLSTRQFVEDHKVVFS